MTDNIPTELLPCPFCGWKPVIEPRKGKFAASVCCDNDACGVRPESLSMDLAYAKARWNTRITARPNIPTEAMPDPRASILAIIRANRQAGESQEVLARDLTTLFRALVEAARPKADGDVVCERYENLILTTPDIDDPQSDWFMRGFAYGRFTKIDSELARHWGVGRNLPADECPITAALSQPSLEK